MKNAQISIRMEEETKLKAEAVFAKLGVSPTDAVRMFYRHVIMENGFPFLPRIPNAETLQAMREVEAGGGETFQTPEELFKSLDI